MQLCFVLWNKHLLIFRKLAYSTHKLFLDQHLTNIRVLSSLLRLPIAPTRNGLIKELALLNIPDLAVEPVRRIYNLLELEFSPLQLAKKINIELEKLKTLGRDDYSQYVEELKNIVATRVLRQVNFPLLFNSNLTNFS